MQHFNYPPGMGRDYSAPSPVADNPPFPAPPAQGTWQTRLNAQSGPNQNAPGYAAPVQLPQQPVAAPGYGAPAQAFSDPAPGYGAPAQAFSDPAPGYGAPAQAGYGVQPQPQPQHDCLAGLNAALAADEPAASAPTLVRAEAAAAIRREASSTAGAEAATATESLWDAG